MSRASYLREVMDLSIVKKDTSRASAVAISEEGNIYHGAQVDSDTNLLSISPEHVALLSAVQHLDYGVQEIVAMQRQPANGELLSPLTLKTIVDFARRTSRPIRYTLLDYTGSKVFSSVNVVKEIDHLYQPEPVVLEKVRAAQVSPNYAEVGTGARDKIDIRQLSLAGIARSFTTSDDASSYGSVAVVDGRAYFSGQYSSFEGRLNIHAEMGAMLAAFMDGHTNVTDIGVVSTKHDKQVCKMCAVCIQFVSEMADRFDIDPKIHNYAFESPDEAVYQIEDYLPLSWSPHS